MLRFKLFLAIEALVRFIFWGPVHVTPDYRITRAPRMTALEAGATWLFYGVADRRIAAYNRMIDPKGFGSSHWFGANGHYLLDGSPDIPF